MGKGPCLRTEEEGRLSSKIKRGVDICGRSEKFAAADKTESRDLEAVKGPRQVGWPELLVASLPRHGFLQPLDRGGRRWGSMRPRGGLMGLGGRPRGLSCLLMSPLP